jgi:hypothetical protein
VRDVYLVIANANSLFADFKRAKRALARLDFRVEVSRGSCATQHSLCTSDVQDSDGNLMMNESSHIGGTLTLCIILFSISGGFAIAAGYFKYAAHVARALCTMC